MNLTKVGVGIIGVLVAPALASAVTLSPLQATVVATTAPARSIAPARQEASTDYLLKIEGVEGESTKAQPALMEIDTIRGETTESKKGNVEYGWKVEEGESAAVPGVEPDEIDVAQDGEPLTPDFSILLGGGSEVSEETRAEVAAVLLKEAQAAGAPVEQISLNYEKIKVTARQPVKLFGLIPMSAAATVEVSADSSVYVRFPWWAFFASGKDNNGVAAMVVSTLSNVLKTRHDTVKNSIGNIR